ncbi:hypothetical protein PEBR_34031 [Penicillium brasilianum]|uniref:DUF7779 domain-containing protein n=1 Tax=Penicillium brasilianum TaxID=104259 RepID=A0A1S9RFL2_PENBI|nr:hypothetical protein PEBR_34031 [Penicillium brasilianum]
MDFANPAMFNAGIEQLYPDAEKAGDIRPSKGLNVLLVPNIGSGTVQKWSKNINDIPWPIRLFPAQSDGVRVLQFKYNAEFSRQFSWISYIDLGRELLECLLNNASTYQLWSYPLLIVAHGFGGILVKKVVSLLCDGSFDPSLRRLLDTIKGLVFLGTPHPISEGVESKQQLDELVCSYGRFSTDTIRKVNEEIAALWTVSSKFEKISFTQAILSGFETLPTRYHYGTFITRRKKVLVGQSLAATCLPSEKLIGISANHREVCSVLGGSRIHDAVTELTTSLLEFSEDVTSDPGLRESLQTPNSAKMWLNTPTASEIDPAKAPQSKSGLASPQVSLQVTVGSDDLSGYEILPAKGGPVSEIPAVRLPCYIFEKDHPPGECYGRMKILDQLDETLLPPKTGGKPSAAADRVRSFALCGPGGIGKTQIAAEFVMTRKAAFDAVFWVNADNEVKLAENFNHIAAKLGLVNELDQGGAVVSRDRVLEWLNSPSKHGRSDSSYDFGVKEEIANWLLVFDNADTPEILAEYWPVAGVGSILVTSRDPVAKTHFYSSGGIDLEPFDRIESAKFLQTLTGNNNEADYEEALVLADRLDGLPLVLVQVASVLQQQDLSFSEFLSLYNDPRFLADVHTTVITGLREKNKRALLNVWQFENLPGSAQRLLDLITMADPDAIPEVIFIHPGLEGLSADVPVDARTFEVARTSLLRGSLIRRMKEEKSIRIHRVIQDAARARMSPDMFNGAFKSFAELVHATWPRGAFNMSHEVQYWTLSARLLPHIEQLRQIYLAQDHTNRLDLASVHFGKLLIDAAWYHMERGNHPSMLPFLECAETVLTAAGLESSMSMALCHFCFSASLQWLRNSDKVRYHCEQSIRISLLNRDDDNLATAYTELGTHYLAVNNYEQALEFSKRSIDIQNTFLNQVTDPATIKSARYLATFPKCHSAYALIGLGRPDEAEELLRPLVNWYDREWGLLNNRSYKTGMAIRALANTLAAQNRMEESFELQELALRQYRLTIGDNHPHTAGTMLKVSDRYVQLGNIDIANALLDEALKVWSNRPYFRPEKAWTLYKKSCIVPAGDISTVNDLRAQAQTLLRSFAEDMKLTIITGPSGEIEYQNYVMFYFR